MWQPREDFTVRMARRMDERWRAKQAAAKAPKPRVLSAEDQAKAHAADHATQVEI